MDLGLKGKRVAVQGASSGLGFAIAEAFSKEGAHVSICSSNQERIQEAARKIPHAHPFAADLDRPGSGKAFIEETVRVLGGIDILVTNTGGPQKGDFAELKMEDWEKGYHRLFRSTVETILEALPYMKKQKFGRILLSTSTSAKEPIPHLTISTGFRTGLHGLMKSLSTEVAPHHITVNAIMPGYTRTDRLAELKVSEDKLIAQIPMARLAEPEEYAALALFLASTRAAYITGQAIACDGGLIHSL